MAVACSGCSGSATASEGDGSEGGTLSAELSSVTAAGDDGSEGDTLLAVPSSFTSPEGGGMSLRVSRRGSARSAAASSARSVASSGGGWPSVRSSSARSAAVWCSLVEGPTTPYIHNATANATMASRVLTMFCALSMSANQRPASVAPEPVPDQIRSDTDGVPPHHAEPPHQGRVVRGTQGRRGWVATVSCAVLFF